MKKSEIYSHLFIYILTIILTSFILIYGYNAISNFKDRADQVSCLKLRNDLINTVKSISSEFGSIKKQELDLCKDYTQICFSETFESITISPGIDPIIEDSLKSNSGKNTFLVEDIAKESFYIGNISVVPDVLCISAINKKLTLRLEGKGNHAELSQWN